MSRPANHGRTAWLNNRRRLKEIEREIAGLDTQREILLAERDERQAFNDLCERYANETPTDQLQPQAVGSAEQGTGAPSQGDGTLPPIAGPCSAENSDSQGEGARSEAQPLARAGGGGESASPDDPTSQTAHPTQPGYCPTCRIVVSEFLGGTPAQCPDCGGPIEQDAPRPLTGGEPSLGAAATGEAPPAGTGSRTPTRHEGPLTEGPGIDSGSSSTPARPDTETYPEIPKALRRRQPNEAAE